MHTLPIAARVALCLATSLPLARADEPVWFEEVAEASGLVWSHVSGARGEHWFPEIMGAGVAFLDYDGDGDLDVYLVQSGYLSPPEDGRPLPGNRLFRNNGDGTFEDVTAAAGVGHTGYGMGVACGDYDRDGDVDVYVTNVGPNVLYRNGGNGTFSDVSAKLSVDDSRWATSAAFVDIDGDRDLDLFVANNLTWDPSIELQCENYYGEPDYCNPHRYNRPSPDVLYKYGRLGFSDVTRIAGVHLAFGNGLGVACGDYDFDGDMDVYVANDETPNQMWQNDGSGVFVDVALEGGCAVNGNGTPEAGMGVQFADMNTDGTLDLFMTHQRRESNTFYRNKNGRFSDKSNLTRMTPVNLKYTGFGLGIHDFDLDGELDVYVANGGVEGLKEDERYDPADPYAEPNNLFRGTGNARYEVVANGGTAAALVGTSRGAAFGDYDDDGDVDIAYVDRDARMKLLRNVAVRRGSWVGFRVLDDRGREAVGAVVNARVGERTLTRLADPAYSYLSSNDARVHFGLGVGADGEPRSSVDEVTVRWPGGAVESFGSLPASAYHVLRKGAGASREEPEKVPAKTKTGSAATPETREMVAILREVAEKSRTDDIYVGDGRARLFREQLADLPADAELGTRWKLIRSLAFEELRLGNTEQAVAHYVDAVELSRGSQIPEPAVYSLVFELGMANLRWGETRNCVARHTSESCLLPIGEKGVHVDQEGAREAIANFEKVLRKYPKSVSIRWLLNLAYMTVGGYPDEVPEEFLIPPETFESDEPFPRFEDVAPRYGVNAFNLSGGSIVEDFDEDGFLDIVTSTWDPGGPMLYYAGRPDGTFEDRTDAAGLTGQLGGLNMIQGDYDGDGFQDILVLRGAWLRSGGRIPNSLLHNDGDGTFTDVTFAAGIGVAHYPTQTASWGDYDNDGDLDLFVGNETDPELSAPCQLFRNEGDGTFVDVAEQAGVQNLRYAKSVMWGDYDGDRLLDLHVSNLFGANRLYHNEGDGTFKDVAPELGVTGPEASFPAWFWDYDNDGILDLFVSSYVTDMNAYAASLLGLEHEAELAKLYRGQAGGGFEDVAAELGLTTLTMPMGSNFGDLDGDGYLDFYLGTGFPEFEALMPNVMYRNRAGKGFADVTSAGGFGHLQKGHGVSFADLDYDGDQDVYIEMGGAFPGDAFGNALFRNPGFDNHWIRVELVGVTSNRSGVGARIRCEITEDGARRSIYKHVNSGGTFGANPMAQMIGLGGAQTVDLLEVYWPTSDTTQTFRDVPADQALAITEGVDALRRLPR